VLILAAIFFLALGLLGGIALSKTINESKIMRTVAELTTALEANTRTVEKIRVEVTGKIGELTASITELRRQLENVQLPPAAEAALVAHEAKLKELDDVIPDPPQVPGGDNPPAGNG